MDSISEQFSDVFFRIMQKYMSYDDGSGLASDRVLWFLFCKYKHDISGHLNRTLEEVKSDGVKEEHAYSLVGFYFHKAFRDGVVVDATDVDWIIWICMRDSKVFWTCLYEAYKETERTNLDENNI